MLRQVGEGSVVAAVGAKGGVEAANARTGPSMAKHFQASARMAMARRNRRLSEEAARRNGRPA